MFKYIVSLLIVFISGLIQQSSFAFWDGIKPNMVLVTALFFASIYTDRIRRIFLLLTAGIAVKTYSGITFDQVIFLGSLVFGMILLDLLPWRRVANVALALTISTLGFYVFAWDTTVAIGELARNAVVMSIVYALMIPFYEKANTKKKRYTF